MKEELIVSLTADIKDLSAKLKEAQNQLQSFSDETQRDFNGITLDNLESQLQALNTELKNTSIGSVRFKELGDEIAKVESKVKTAFNSISRVGTSGFNGLNNSINQITRELPAFGLSANIGFLAISNNIPILIDEINRLKQANISLAQSGQPTKSIFSSITSALFSYQTALSLGVTLMTIYGGKIIEFAQKAFTGVEGFDAYKSKLDALNSAYESKSVSKAIADVMLLSATFKNARGSIALEEDALKKYNETIKDSTLQKKTFAEADREFTANTNTYINSVIARAAADKLALQAADAYLEVAKEQGNIDRRTIELNKLKQQLNEMTYKDIENGANKALLIRQQELKYAISQSKEIVDTKQKEVDAIKKIIESVDFNYIEASPSGTTDIIKGSINDLENQLKELNKEYNNTKIGTTRYKELAEAIKSVTIKLDELRGGGDRNLPDFELLQGAKEQIATAKELFNLYKESPKSLGLLGEEYVSNPFFRDLINGDLKTKTDETQAAFQKFLNTKRDDTSGGGMPIDKEIEAANEQAQALVSTLGNGLTAAFEAAMTNGTNFFSELGAAILNMIKKLLAAIAVASILSAILGGFNVAASSVGKGTTLFGNILGQLTGGLLGGNGGASGQRVSSGVTSSSNSGSVEFEIRGDKLYGVLQNYQGRLDRLV